VCAQQRSPIFPREINPDSIHTTTFTLPLIAERAIDNATLKGDLLLALWEEWIKTTTAIAIVPCYASLGEPVSATCETL